MVSYLYRMPAGIPGEVISLEGAYIEPQEIQPTGSTGAPAEYGLPLVMDATSKKMRSVGVGDTAALIRGFLVRPFPTNANQDALGVNAPPTKGSCDVLRRGRITVRLRGATAATKGGVAYVWSAASSGSNVQGGIVAADPTSNGFAISATFDGPADSDGNVGISYNI